MKTLTLATFTPQVLVPGWILLFGLIAAWAPPLGVAASLSVLVVGIVVVPAVLLIGSAGASTTHS